MVKYILEVTYAGFLIMYNMD